MRIFTFMRPLFSHIFFLPGHLFIATFRNPINLLAFIAALVKLPAIIERRRKEKWHIRISDKDLQEVFTDQ
ncbi:hypothetical protein D1AOALGA4SA_10595 [Olavius algarvensis Delta 1 endosymbiont]|nr:hypothetical protein D1AOALGA4SA_10595 [Olavius algarvensis Delta 1 endosymbiont]